MCRKLYHIHTFSNKRAFLEVINLIDVTTKYNSKQPKGIFYGINQLDSSLKKDWDKHPYTIKKAYYDDDCIGCKEFKFSGWSEFRDSIKETSFYHHVFGIIKIELI